MLKHKKKSKKQFQKCTHNLDDGISHTQLINIETFYGIMVNYKYININKYLIIYACDYITLPLYRTLLNVLVIILSSGFGVSPI